MRFEYNKEYPFAAYITNLGKYNEGELVGEWLKFPTDSYKIKEVFANIGIGSNDIFGIPYEEWFITDYDIYVDKLDPLILGEYPSIKDLNILANCLLKMADDSYEIFKTIIDNKDISGVDDYIELCNEVDNYILLSDIKDEYDLGYYCLNEYNDNHSFDIEHFGDYIDYAGYGHDVASLENGLFSDSGYIYKK